MPGPADSVMRQLVERRLSTRDKRLRQNLQQEPWVEQEALAQDLTPENIQALARAIDRAPTPQQRAILQGEMDRLRDLASNLHGPVEQPAPPAGTIPEPDVMRLPYNPREGVGRPNMLTEQPVPTTYSDIPRGHNDINRSPPPMPAAELPPLTPMQRARGAFDSFWMPLMEHIEQGTRGRDRVGPPTAAEAEWDAKMQNFRAGVPR